MPTAIQTVSRPESRLHYVRAPRAVFQLIAGPDQVLVDVQASPIGVDGIEHPEHATALCPLADARQLLLELAAAVSQAERLTNPRAKLYPVPAPGWRA